VALTLLSRTVHSGDRVLDLGSGSGILAIAALKLGAARAIGIEIDAEANEVAVRNGVRNGVVDRVEFVEGDAAFLAPLAGPADVLLSNILRTVNTALLPVIAKALAPGGIAIFSGMEQSEAEDFRYTLAHAGYLPVQETVDSGWWGIAAQRRQ
jgi:ribosomal protein L11 methyltransferase